MQKLTAVAHRGAPYRVRENTIDSLRTALDLGADAVEVDVRLTRDGVPVLLHDHTLKRLWEHDRPLLSLSADEVRGLTDGRVPTLAEALRATDGHRLMLDLPGTARRPGSPAAWSTWSAEQGAQDRVYYCADAHRHARRPRGRPVRGDRAHLDQPRTPAPRPAERGQAPLAQLPLHPDGPGPRVASTRTVT